MRKLLLLVLTLILTNAYTQPQPKDTAKQELVFLPLVYANRQLTYLTFFQGLGNLPPMLTEMGFSGSYFLKKNEVWALEANLNMVLRIRNEKSFPVPPPSYNPVLTYYRQLTGWNGSFMSRLLLANAYWEISMGHHSNGKAGYFFKRDSLGNRTNGIDMDNANFSTDYLELAFITFEYREINSRDFISNLLLAFRLCPPLLSSEELKDIYGFYRLFVSYNIFGVPMKKADDALSNFVSRSRLRIHSGWIFGRMAHAATGEANKRLIADVTWFYYPQWLAEVGFFVQYYRGQDYYNIQFERTMETFRIGITSNPINFGVLNDL